MKAIKDEDDCSDSHLFLGWRGESLSIVVVPFLLLHTHTND